MNRETKRKAKKAGLPESIVLVHEKEKTVTELAVAWTAKNELALVFVQGNQVIYKADALAFLIKLGEMIQAEYEKIKVKDADTTH
jgi:hypothetical protein